MRAREEAVAGHSPERDTYLIYCTWSDNRGVWVQSEMQSFAAVVVVVVVSRHFPPGTPFGRHRLRSCKHNAMWNILHWHTRWCLDLEYIVSLPLRKSIFCNSTQKLIFDFSLGQIQYWRTEKMLLLITYLTLSIQDVSCEKYCWLLLLIS